MAESGRPFPRTKVEFLERVREAYQDLTAAIAGFSDEELLAPNMLGSWSIRDVIAHVGADQQWMAGQLEALLAGRAPTAASCYGGEVAPPEGIDLGTQDGRNAWQRERLAGLSLPEAQEMAEASHARLRAVIESLTDDDLSDKLTIAELGTTGQIRRPEPGEPAWPLWEWLRGVTYHHYADHAKDIRAARGVNLRS